MKVLIILLCSTLISACIFSPAMTHKYDADCNVTYRQLEYKFNPNEIIPHHCHNDSCLDNLFFIPIELLVAGSIIIVGNSAFWLEKELSCAHKQRNEAKQAEEKDNTEETTSADRPLALN